MHEKAGDVIARNDSKRRWVGDYAIKPSTMTAGWASVLKPVGGDYAIKPYTMTAGWATVLKPIGGRLCYHTIPYSQRVDNCILKPYEMTIGWVTTLSNQMK